MATLRMATGQVLGTVANTAASISSIVNTVSEAAGMGNDYVTRARNKAQEAAVVDTVNFREGIIRQANLEATKGELEILSFVGNDENKASIYNKYDEKMRAAFAKYDQKKSEQD